MYKEVVRCQHASLVAWSMVSTDWTLCAAFSALEGRSRTLLL